jgi:surface antigen
MEENRAMNRLLLVLSCGALGATSLAAGAPAPAQKAQTASQAPANETPEARARRLQYEQEVRDAEAGRLRYEEAQRQHQADLVRYQHDLERAQRAQRRYERRRARYDARHPDRRAEPEPAPLPPETTAPAAPAESVQAAPAAVSSEQCQRQNRRNRGRGRVVGGILGGVAGAALGRGSTVRRLATIALAAPVGALIGDAISRLLDCREQEQAAHATEQAVERGVVGTTTTWSSETRPNVTGSSTVTAAATPLADGNPCVTVTDIVIVEGEETRAPKTMCRRPPSNRFVRV